MALPSFADYLDDVNSGGGVSQASPAPQPSGTGNFLTAGLGSGFYTALSQAGSAGEAAGRALGMDKFADSAKAFGDAQRETAATYARPDLENAPIYNPEALAYRISQMVPGMAGAVAGGAIGGEAAPLIGLGAVAGRLIGAGAAMYPASVGENVQRREDYEGYLDQGNALKALAYGVPEAAIQGVVPGHVEGSILKGLGRGFGASAARAAVTQAGAAGATEWLTQQMGDPNRSFASRAQDIITSALQGGVLGGVTGAILHPLNPAHEIAKTPAQLVNNDQMNTVINQALAPPPPIEQHVPAPGDIVRAQQQQQANFAAGQAATPPVFGRGTNGLAGAPPETFTPLDPTRVGVGPFKPGAPVPENPPPLTQYQGEPRPAAPPPPFDWAATKTDLQKNKALDPLTMKGPFTSQDDLNNTVAENIFNRLADGKKVAPRLLAAGKKLGVIDDNNNPTPAFAQKANDIAEAKGKPLNVAASDEADLEGPTGPTPGSFTAPDRQPRDAINGVHQKRWDALEAVRNRLLGDNLSDPDVQQLLTKTSDLQNELLNVKRGRASSIDAQTSALWLQAGARDADAKSPAVGPTVDKRAPATGPEASPAAQEVIDKAQPTQTAAPTPQTKEAQVKAKRQKKAAPAPEPEAQAPVAATTPAPATMKDKVVQEAVADGSAPPPVTAQDIQGQQPNQAFAEAFARQSAKEGGKTSSIGVTARRTREQMVRDTRQAVAVPKALSDTSVVGELIPPPINPNTTFPRLGKEGVSGQRAPFGELPPREQAIQRDARYWEYLRTSHPEDIEARAQAAEHLDEATRQLTAPQPKDEATTAALNQRAQEAITDQQARRMVEQPMTKEGRAQAARQAVLAKRPPVEAHQKRGNLDAQHNPERVKPKLAKSVDEVQDVQPQRELDPNNPKDRMEIKRRQANEAAPPAVDPSVLAGFARDGRRTQADARREAMNNGLRARTALVESGRRPVVPVPQKVQAQLAAARASLDALEKAGAIIPRHEDFAGKYERFQQLVTQHREQLNLAQRAADNGLEGLREIPRDYFGTDLFDEMSGHVTPQTERSLEQHAIAESQLQDAAALARGERPLIKYSQPPTQHDVDLSSIINATRSMTDTLGHIRDNGLTMQSREMAKLLLKNGAGGTIEMHDNLPASSGLQPRDGEYFAGMHFTALDHTQIYDGGGIEGTVLHEAVHSATDRALNRSGPASQEMKALFDRVKVSADGDAYGLTNVHEFVAEGMSNPHFQQFLKSQDVSTGSRIGDMWQSFKNTIFKMLGMPDRMRTLFDQVMDNANRLMGENVAEASTNTNNLVRRGGQQFSEAATQAGNALIRKLTHAISDDKATKMEMGARRAALGFSTGDHIEWQLKDHIPSATEFVGLQNHRPVRTDTLSKQSVDALKTMHALPKNGQEALNRLQQKTIQNVDGSRSWKDNAWLHGNVQENELKAAHAEAQNDYNVLRNTPGGVEAYQKSIDANEVARHLRDLHMLFDTYKREWGKETWSGYDTDPIRDYEANDRLHDDPAQAKLQLDARKLTMLAGMAKKASDLETLINSLKVSDQANLLGHLILTDEQRAKLTQDIKTTTTNREVLDGLVKNISALDERAKQGPYFHLGRDGDHFVSAHVITNNGVPDDAALMHIKDEMEKAGLGHHIISRGVDNSSIYLRMKGEAQREIAFDLFKKLQSAGIIDAKKTVTRGLSNVDMSLYKSIGPQWMRSAIEAVQASKPDLPVGSSQATIDAVNLAHEQMIREQTRALMDMLPDTSITKLYARRMNVQGFNEDMMHSYKASAIANARGLANMSLARELGLASVQMNKELEAKQASGQIKGEQLTAISQAMGELTLRNKLYQAHVPSTFMDGVRRMVHTFQIGASPAYFMTLMSQIPTLTLPELAKTHGYARSALAMGRAANESLAVMRAVMAGKDGITFGLRRSDLEKAGIKPSTVDFIMQLAARGTFNQGAYTEAMTGHQTDGVLGKLTQYGSVMGRYAEQFPRILTALAAKELHESQLQKAGGANVHDFAYQKVMGSQFNWNPELNARQTTRSGMFGAMSPLINQFMGFQIRMTEKLYREIATGFGSRAGSPEEAAQSRKWIYGHAAAVTMLAGTLGLPALAVAASVYDRLADFVTDEDNHDVTATYRNFLARSFGKPLGEAIARGAPRLAGMDFDHLGEGSMLPGVPGAPVVAKLLQFGTEKRKLEDAEKDWLKNMAGSSMGFIFNTAAAARDISNGDFMDAGIKISPELLKGGLEAYRLGERGYVDKQGNKLPITATAADVMLQAMGIDPAKEAEYDEEKKTATGLQNMRQMRSQNITRHLLLAFNRNDEGSMEGWQREAMRFNMDHPGMPSPLMDFKRTLMAREKGVAIARGFGTPLGVHPRDVVGRGMSAFGNLRNDGAQ